jgi:hypothetical protein
MSIPVGSAVIVAWDGSVGGIEHPNNTEVGVVYAHTSDGHHMIHFDNPALRKYARHRWPLCHHEHGKTWNEIIVVDAEDDDVHGAHDDPNDLWDPTGMPLPTDAQRMMFVLERPPTREAAVYAAHALTSHVK